MNFVYNRYDVNDLALNKQTRNHNYLYRMIY